MSLHNACLFVAVAFLAASVTMVSAGDVRRDVQDDGHSSYQSYEFSGRFHSKYGPSNSFPEDPTNLDGWIDYGIGVGIGFAILFVLGMILTPTMWIACCCIKSGRCIPEFSDSVNKKFIIAYTVYFVIMLIFGFAAIGTTVSTSGNIVGTVESVKKFSDSVGSFGSDIATDLRDVQGRLTNEVDSVNNTLANFDFGVIFAAIDTLDFVLSNVTSTITYMNDTANLLASQYDMIISNYTYLQQKERDGVIYGVPKNNTVIDAPKDNNAYIQSSQANLNTYQANVNSARSSVSQASNQYRSSRDAEIQSAKDAINGPISDQINGVQSLTSNLSFSRENVGNTVDPWVSLTNSVRMGIVIGFVLLNLLFIGLWFVGVFKTKPALTEVPYWIAAFTLFWIMLLAAIHIVIFIPTRDVCDRKIAYLTSPTVTGMLRNMVPANLLNNTAFSNLFDTVASSPLLILNCQGNETFFSNLNLDLFAFVPEANTTLNDLVTNFEAGTSQIDVSSAANQALAAFDYVRNNLTAIQDSVFNYTIRISDAQFLLTNLTQQLNVTNFGAQTESALLGLVDGINYYTVPYGYTYTLYNFDTLDINSMPWLTMDSNNRTNLNNTLTDLTSANQTYTDALIQIADISAVIQSMNSTFNLAYVEVLDLVRFIGWIQGNASLAETTLASMTSLQRNFIDTAIAAIKQAVANTRDILKLGTVGKCSFIGDFYNNGVEGGMCNGLSKSVGGAGVTLAIFGLLMFASTWLILWTKPALFVGGIKGIKDDDL